MTSAIWQSKALTAICEELLDEWDLTPEEIKVLAADIPGECDNLRTCQAEQAFERQQASLLETGGVDDSGYRRQMIEAGRGHLLGGGRS